MGGGDGDLNAWENPRSAGWAASPVRGGTGTHELGPVEGPTMLPQALVVTTAASEFWFESRGQATPSFTGDAMQPAGIAVLAGPAAGGELSVLSTGEPLASEPGQAGGASVRAPRSLRQARGSSASPSSATRSGAQRFGSSGSTGSGRDVPPLRVRTTRGRVRLSWDAARERGERHRQLHGGHRRPRGADVPLRDPLTTWTAAFRVARGFHRVGVYATDRAGNRGRLGSPASASAKGLM